MARAEHFRVSGRLDMAKRPSYGTVTIDRDRNLFSVRPLRRRRLYTLELSRVAEMVVHTIIIAEIRAEDRARLSKYIDKRNAKRAKREARSHG